MIKTKRECEMKHAKKCAHGCCNSVDAMTMVDGLNHLSLSQKVLLGITLGLIISLAANVLIDAWLAFAKWLVINVGGNPYGW